MSITQIHNGEVALSDVVAMRVRGLLAERQLKQGDLAKILGRSQASTSDRLRGVKDFDLNEIPVVARALRVSELYLLGFTDERSPRRSVPDEGSLIDLRARRDSNPKPSDLVLAPGAFPRLAKVIGLRNRNCGLDGSDRVNSGPSRVNPQAETAAVVIPFPRRAAEYSADVALPLVLIGAGR